MKKHPDTKREDAATAAKRMRAWLSDDAVAGERSVAHIDFARPRRGAWVEMWSGLPGLMRDCGSGTWTHVLLPGWQYTPAEMRTEMIEDLEHFAESGEQPKTATR